jgi:hypothetical protein
MLLLFAEECGQFWTNIRRIRGWNEVEKRNDKIGSLGRTTLVLSTALKFKLFFLFFADIITLYSYCRKIGPPPARLHCEDDMNSKYCFLGYGSSNKRTGNIWSAVRFVNIGQCLTSHQQRRGYSPMICAKSSLKCDVCCAKCKQWRQESPLIAGGIVS